MPSHEHLSGIFLPILASFSANTGILFCQYWHPFLLILAAKYARSVRQSQVFPYQYWHFRSCCCFFLSALDVLYPTEIFDHDVTVIKSI